MDSVSPRPPYLPPAVPEDLVDRIARLHGDPVLWWVSQVSSSHWSMLLILASHWSQVLKFILRPQPHLRALLQATEEHFNHPIVGVHIRRTDKVALMNEEWKMDSDISTRLELRQHFTLWRSTWLTCWNGSGSRD